MPAKRDPCCDTAILILKGAIIKVLHTPTTAKVDVTNKTKGKIAVVYELEEAPVAATVEEIEKIANELIEKNIGVALQRNIPREKAEKQFVESPEIYSYEKFPVPESVKKLTVVEIQDWIVSSCTPNHEYVTNTNEVPYIKIVRTNFRPQKKELEFCFELQPDLEKKAPKVQKVAQKPERRALPIIIDNGSGVDDCNAISSKITDLFLTSLEIDNEENRIKVDSLVQSKLLDILVALKNTSYTTGFTCNKLM